MSDETASPPPQIKITWLIGTLAAFALFVVIGAYSSRMTWTYSDYDQDRAAERKVNLAGVQKAERALLYPAVDAQGQSHAEWVDQAKGTIRLPIDEAMSKELDTLKAQPAAIGAEIPGAVPPAPATPTPAAITPSAGATNAAPAKAAAPAAKSTATSTAAGPAAANTPQAKPNPSNK